MRYTTASKWSKERFTIDHDDGNPQFEVVRIYGLDGNSLSLRDSGTTSSLRSSHEQVLLDLK